MEIRLKFECEWKKKTTEPDREWMSVLLLFYQHNSWIILSKFNGKINKTCTSTNTTYNTYSRSLAKLNDKPRVEKHTKCNMLAMIYTDDHNLCSTISFILFRIARLSAEKTSLSLSFHKQGESFFYPTAQVLVFALHIERWCGVICWAP